MSAGDVSAGDVSAGDVSAGSAGPAPGGARGAGRTTVPNVLERILAATRAQVAQRRRDHPLPAGGEAVPEGLSHRFERALTRPGMSVIAEFKRRSPSAGEIRPGAEPPEIARAYERGGASALSVLTEEPSFGGSLADLRAARAATDLPVLRKDFIVDPYQLLEARGAGADAVLLIVAALDDRDLGALHAGAVELGLDVVVEVHDHEELRRALAIGPRIIGVNNRDLRDFSVDVGRTLELAADVPPGTVLISESGIVERSQLHELAEAGVSAVLVGEALMRAPDPERALRDLLA